MTRQIDLVAVDNFLKNPSFNEPKTFFKYLRLIEEIISPWLISGKIRNYKVLLGISFWWFTIVNLLHIILTICAEIYFEHGNSVHVVEQISKLMIFIDALFHMILFQIERPRFQILLSEIEQYLNVASFWEMEIINEYYKRYTILLSVLAFTFTISVLITVFIDPAISRSLPIDVWYPFPVNHFPSRCIIYAIQAITIAQTSIILPIDFTIISLFWYAGARLKILGIELGKVSSDSQFRNWIQSHQNLIWFVKKMEGVLGLIMFKTITLVAIIIISGGFQLKNGDTKVVLTQFGFIIFTASLRLFSWSHPVDDLTEMNENIKWSACNLAWSRKSRKMIQSSLIVIQRCYKPLTVDIGSRVFNLCLSLKFFASYMSTIFSYYLALNAIYGDGAKKLQK